MGVDAPGMSVEPQISAEAFGTQAFLPRADAVEKVGGESLMPVCWLDLASVG